MIRIGIVGCGRILAAHLRGYRILRKAGIDDFRITALCARKPDDARMYVRRGEGPPQRAAVSDIPGDPLAAGDIYLSDFQTDTQVAVFDDYETMIAAGPVDAINDFTPHGLHHLVGDCAFRNGKHLLSQKPLAVTVKAARQMVDSAQRAGVVLGTFENLRYREQARQLKWMFEPDDDSRPCGRLQTMLMGNIGSWWVPDKIVAETPWRHQRELGGGIALDLGPHMFNLIRNVAGEVLDVQARTAILEPLRFTRGSDGTVIDSIASTADDTFFATFETQRGIAGSLNAAWAGHGAPTVVEGGQVFYGSKARVAGTTVTFDDGSTTELSDIYRQHCPADRQEADFPNRFTDEFAVAQQDWLRAIREQTQPESNGHEGLMDLACAFGIVESALSGNRVTVEDIVQGRVAEYQNEINSHFGI